MSKKASDFDYIKILPFLDLYQSAWEQMRDELGREVAFGLAQLSRDNIIRELRLVHRWRLSRIGKLFGMTRERARQIVGVGGTPGVSLEMQPYTEEDMRRALSTACVLPDAWTQKGKISKVWLAKFLGSHKRVTKTVNCHTLHKFDVLMKYGLNLDTDAITQQMQNWQALSNFSYSEIAELLSDRFVPITTMAVFRGAQRNGYKGDSVGAPGRGRRYYTSKKPPEIKADENNTGNIK